MSAGLCASVSILLLISLLLFYKSHYSIHQDLAGGALSGQLAVTLGESFDDYSVYFPPAERAWFTLAVWLSNLAGLRLDLVVIEMSGAAVLFSAGLAYHIRRVTVGASPLFFIVSVVVLVVLPVLFKNVFGLREHMVALGLWPYVVLRLSEPDDSSIGWKTRALLGLWLGATLLLKYLFALVVLLVELVDAVVQRRRLLLFRIENLIAGSLVALYLFCWLVIDSSQREAIQAMVSAIDANLVNRETSVLQAAIHLAPAFVFLVLAFFYRSSARTAAIGLAMVAGSITVAWAQSRWYSHHLFPITMAYVAWLWMIYRDIRLLLIVPLALIVATPIFGEFRNTARYQRSVSELVTAMDEAGLSIAGKRVGVLAMHPSPLNQYLASHGGVRWNAAVNSAYVAAELRSFDRLANPDMRVPQVKLNDPGRRLLHNEMIRLWEDFPPDVLILDESTSWPLRNIDVKWTKVFSQEPRFQSILVQYQPIMHHKGKWLNFTYYERAE